FLKSLPSRIGNLLDITLKDLEKVLYCEAYIVIDPKSTSLLRGEILTEDKYHKLLEELGDDAFAAGMGGEAVRELLRFIAKGPKGDEKGIEELSEQLRTEM